MVKPIFRVCVAGCSGSLGQVVALLLKQCYMVKELICYDIMHAPGVSADISHVDSPAEVTYVHGIENIDDAFENIDIAVITSGIPRRPGMTRDDLFEFNGAILKEICESIGKVGANPMINVVTDPINSCVPLAAEVLKKFKHYDPLRLFGSTTVDVIRTKTFLAELKKLDLKGLIVPVIGGHGTETIIPIFSQSSTKVDFTDDEYRSLVYQIQEAGTEVVKIKAGFGGPNLTNAYAAAWFTVRLMRAISGEQNIVECAYVASNVTEATFFATPLLLGKKGIEKNLGMPKMTPAEKLMVDRAMPTLLSAIKRGQDFANADPLQ